MTIPPTTDQHGSASQLKSWHSCMIMLGTCTPPCTCKWCEYFTLTPSNDGTRVDVTFSGYPATDFCWFSPFSMEDICNSEEAMEAFHNADGPLGALMTAAFPSFDTHTGFAGFVRACVISESGRQCDGVVITCEELTLEEKEFLQEAIRSHRGAFLSHFSDEDRTRCFWRGPGTYTSDAFIDFIDNFAFVNGGDAVEYSEDLVLDIPDDVSDPSIELIRKLLDES